MLEIAYDKLIRYPFEVTLSQYFDYEHIAHVHPKTVGEYRIVERSGNVIVYDQVWPANRLGKRATSRVRHTFEPPDSMWFEFVAGRYRGTKVHSRLEDCGCTTRVWERYLLPLPNWAWLRPLVRPSMVRAIERIWDEDLRVEICIGGWPGVPGSTNGSVNSPPPMAASGRHVIGNAADYPPARIYRAQVDGQDVAIAAQRHGYRAVGGRCPHTGGPLALGTVERDCIVCPWHGARFCLESGRSQSDVTHASLPTYAAVVEGEHLVVYVSGD